MSRKRNNDFMQELDTVIEKDALKLAEEIASEEAEKEVFEEIEEVKVAEPVKVKKTVACVKAAYLNVRNKPNGSIVGKLSDKTVIELEEPIKENGDWTCIGEDRWVMSKYLK